MLDDESRALKTANVKGTAPFYVVFLELSSGKLEGEEIKTLENKVCKLRYKAITAIERERGTGGVPTQ